MKNQAEVLTDQLFEKECISKEQFENIKNYRNKELFSLRFELRTFLYVSILMFTSGIGILIYQNIDTIGHTALLSIVFLATVACFYFSHKNSKGFSKSEVKFLNPLYDYLVLAANMLFCIFIGYLQYQYQPFGSYHHLATLIPTIVALVSAYYFDNKSVLSIGITGLAAFWGLSVTPLTLWNSGQYSIDSLSYTALFLGIGLFLWNQLSDFIKLKTHFALVFLTFALHLISISCITNLFGDYWFIFGAILAGAGFVFYNKSYQLQSVTLVVFTVIYSYVGFNILIFNFLEFVNAVDFFAVIAYLSPFYFVGSIYLFIQLIKKFRNKISHDSI